MANTRHTSIIAVETLKNTVKKSGSKLSPILHTFYIEMPDLYRLQKLRDFKWLIFTATYIQSILLPKKEI